MKRKHPDPAAVGDKVLRNLAKGRAQLRKEQRAQTRFWKKVITDFAWLDLKDGGSRRGLARRIAGKLHKKLSERQVRKYLASLAKSSD